MLSPFIWTKTESCARELLVSDDEIVFDSEKLTDHIALPTVLRDLPNNPTTNPSLNRKAHLYAENLKKLNPKLSFGDIIV